MGHNELYQSLLSYNSYEQMGKVYCSTYQKNMDYEQFLFLIRRYSPDFSLEHLMSSQAVAEQEKLKKHFQANYRESGLTEQGFFTEGKNIEIEKLLRYINIPKHRHSFTECAFIFSGTCTHTINTNEYAQQRGSFTFITSGSEHELHASPDCLCLTIKIRPSLFASLRIPNMPLLIYPVSFQCGEDPFVRHIVLSLYEQQENELAYSDQLIEDLFQVLITYIMQNYRDTMQVLVADSVQSEKLIKIINYMYENYQTVTLHALAKHFHFSEAYLSNMFHQQTGMTYSKTLKSFRLRRASELLKQTDMKLNEVCEAIGYKDTSQFIKNFKEEYGMTPTKYRRHNEA